MELEQANAVTKALSIQECPVKEKHVGHPFLIIVDKVIIIIIIIVLVIVVIVIILIIVMKKKLLVKCQGNA